MRGHRFLGRGGETVPQVPPVTDLHRGRQSIGDGLRVGRGSVPAHDLHPGVGVQPGDEGRGGAIREHVHPAVGDRVDEDGGVTVPAPQREVIHAQDPWCQPHRDRDGHQPVQDGGPADRMVQMRQQAGTGFAGQRDRDHIHDLLQRGCASLIADR